MNVGNLSECRKGEDWALLCRGWGGKKDLMHENVILGMRGADAVLCNCETSKMRCIFFGMYLGIGTRLGIHTAANAAHIYS